MERCRLRPQAAQDALQILLNDIPAGDQDQRDDGRKEHPEGQADRHGDQELGLNTLLQDHGHQPGKGGQ